MSIEYFFNRTVIVYRQEEIPDDYGGASREWEIHLDEYKCRIQSGAGRIIMRETGQTVPSTHKLIGELADIKAGHKISDNGEEYLVLVISTASQAQKAHHLEGYLRRMNGD